MTSVYHNEERVELTQVPHDDSSRSNRKVAGRDTFLPACFDDNGMNQTCGDHMIKDSVCQHCRAPPGVTAGKPHTQWNTLWATKLFPQVATSTAPASQQLLHAAASSA